MEVEPFVIRRLAEMIAFERSRNLALPENQQPGRYFKMIRAVRECADRAETDFDRHYLHRAADILTTLDVAILASSHWLPIETAPKDGTKVDLWFPNIGREVDWEWWDGTDDPWDSRPQWIFRGANVVKYPAQQPTHWMPTPFAPVPRDRK